MNHQESQSISVAQARQTLNVVQAAADRGTTLYRYRLASPYFLLWGVVWALGYGLSDWWPAQTGWIWLALDVIGVAASIVITSVGHARRGAGHAMPWRIAGLALIVLAYFAAAFLVMAPQTGRQVSTFITLTVALAYSVVGIWAGSRWMFAGLAVCAAALIGYFHVPVYFNTWMGLVGGGALVLSGIWLRRV
ncbi:MAG: hypothetical protein IPO19_10430 [Rhodoferax sp.]|nr:hypothetical protein [Rhodoferax sp.]